MKLDIKGNTYVTAPFVAHHAMMAIEIEENANLTSKDKIAYSIQAVAESLISGTEKIPYDEIKEDKLSEYVKLISMNLTITKISDIYITLATDTGGEDGEGKPNQ